VTLEHHLQRRVRSAGLTLAVAALAGAWTSPASAATGLSSRTVTATCDVSPQLSLPPADLSRLEVRVNATLPSAVKPGETFPFDRPSLRFFADPAAESPTTGQYSLQLESATVTATGTVEHSAPLKDAPLDLGTVDRSKSRLLRWLAPPSGALGPIGPFTATTATRKAEFGLTFTLQVNYVDPNQPTFAPVGARLTCKTDAPIASVPVYRPATGLPTVAKVLPNRAAPDSWVNVYGRRLESATSVEILGFEVAYEIVSSTQIRAKVPSPAFFIDPGPFVATRVNVTNDLGASRDTRYDDLAFLYSPTYTGPAVTSVTPDVASSTRTQVVWLEGSALKGATSVTIGGEEAPFIAFGDNRIVLQTTPRPAGRYGIGVTAPAGTMPDEQIFIRYE
jgi:IPT/TIG domain